MAHAYDRLYLSQARDSLGLMLDFVVYDINLDLRAYWKRFNRNHILYVIILFGKIEKGDLL